MAKKEKAPKAKKNGRGDNEIALDGGKLVLAERPSIRNILKDRLNSGKTVIAQEIAAELGVSYPAIWQVLRSWLKKGVVQREPLDNTETGGPVKFRYFLAKK